MSKTLWIVAGPNGAGKSTMVSRYNRKPFTVCNPDNIARDLSPAAPEKAAVRAGKIAIHQKRYLLEAGRSFIMETTFSGARAVDLIQEAHDHGYKVRLAFVAVSAPSVSLLRVRSRVAEGGHNVPSQDIMRRYNRAFDSLKRAIPEADQTLIIDNSKHSPAVIVKFSKGKIQRLYHRSPKWLQERVPQLKTLIDRTGVWHRGGAVT